MAQRINEQIRTLAAIESETHFFEVGREMLRADAMPRSHDAALKKRERGFDGVRVNVAHHVDAATVIDGLVLVSIPAFFMATVIGVEIVGHNHVHIFADILADVLCERSRLRIAGMEQSQIAIALADAE